MRRPQLVPALLLAAAGAVLAAQALCAQPPVQLPPVFTVGSVVDLPASSGPGFGTPAVALRPGGGFVAIWGDFGSGQVVGRSFDADASQPGGDVFVLSEGDPDLLGPVLLARGEGDSFLAVWIEGPDRMLHVRRFDGEGQPLSAVAEISTSSLFSGPGTAALASSPGGGFVLAWWQELGNGVRLAVERLAPDGQLLGGGLVVDLAPGSGPVNVRMAVGSSGAIGVSWSEYRPSDFTATLRARVLSPDLVPLGAPVSLVAEDSAYRPIEHDLGAVGGWDFLVAWKPQLGPSVAGILARRFHPGGVEGPERRIDYPGPTGQGAYAPAVAAVPGGGGVVAWAQEGEGEVRVIGRLVEVDGSLRGMPFEVHPGPVDGHLLNGIDLDRDRRGAIVVAWGIGVESGIGTPVGLDFYRNIQAVRLLEREATCGPLSVLDLRTEPPTPSSFGPTRLILGAAGECTELSVNGWSRDASTIRVDTYVDQYVCDPPQTFEQSLPVDLGPLSAGIYSVVVDVAGYDGPLCTREMSLPVTAEPPAPPPGAPLLMSEEVPGFAAVVRFTDPLGNPTFGTRELACIPETLCVSGNLPGRSELFIRVVGPKPNGRLWPTLVKFSTSTVEVWLVQLATLEDEYYRLEGAAPGVDELPGLFDREGFVP